MRARSSSRPPSVGERAILEWIAAHALPADSPYREQIKNVQQLLDLYAKLDNISAVELSGTRAGKPLKLTLRLR